MIRHTTQFLPPHADRFHVVLKAFLKRIRTEEQQLILTVEDDLILS